jgi:ribosomal protein S18 acetylase RimI-like enzyme
MVAKNVSDPLENPAWHALIDRQGRQGQRTELAARFLPAISPLAALRAPTRAALDELASLCGRDPAMVLSGAPRMPDSSFRVARTVAVRQMCCEVACEAIAVSAERLGNADATDMVALVTLTEPGPFAQRTVELGSYFGIRDGGRLIAMAGERLKPPGWVEVSGVCTHPDGRGHGYALGLVARVMNDIFARGERAFLYVAVGSPSEKSATRIYERLGFRFRREMYVHVLLPQRSK